MIDNNCLGFRIDRAKIFVKDSQYANLVNVWTGFASVNLLLVHLCDYVARRF